MHVHPCSVGEKYRPGWPPPTTGNRPATNRASRGLWSSGGEAGAGITDGRNDHGGVDLGQIGFLLRRYADPFVIPFALGGGQVTHGYDTDIRQGVFEREKTEL